MYLFDINKDGKRKKGQFAVTEMITRIGFPVIVTNVNSLMMMLRSPHQ